MKIKFFYDKHNFKKSDITIPKFDELDDLKVFISESLSTNVVMKESCQLVYENIILTDCNKLIKYISMRDYEKICIGYLEDFLHEDNVIVELFVCQPIPSLIQLIVKKQDKISVLKSGFDKFELNIDCIWNIKGKEVRMEQCITDDDFNDDGYIKLIIKSDNSFTDCLNIHNQSLIEYYLRNNDLTYLWYRDEFNLSQTNSLRQILYQMKLALMISIDDFDCLLSNNLQRMPSSFVNSRFLFIEIMTNRLCEFCNDHYWESLMEKFGFDEIVFNVFRQYFRDAVRVEIIDYRKSIRHSENITNKSMKKIAIDALDYCFNYLIYPKRDWRYLMGLFLGEFSIGFVNDLFVDEIIYKWKESHSNLILNWDHSNNLSTSSNKKDFQLFINSIEFDSDEEVKNKFKIEFLEMEDQEFWRPLHHACRYGRVSLVKLLLSSQCNIHLHTKDGYQPIHFASLNGHFDIVKILIKNKCDINVSNYRGYQPIHLACENGHIDIVKILIKNKCDINTSNYRGYQPIHLACENGHIDIVKILMKNKCDINTSNYYGYQPIHLAHQCGHIEIVEILKAEIRRVNTSDNTPNYLAEISMESSNMNEWISTDTSDMYEWISSDILDMH